MAGAIVTPGFAKPRSELPWLPYESEDRVIINAHNFGGYLYPSLRAVPPVLGYYARLDAGAAATDQFTDDGSQDGTLTNGATRADDGGLAYSLDGVNDHIAFGPTTATTVHTLSCWVKSSDAGDAIVIGGGINIYGLYFDSSGAGGKIYYSAATGIFGGRNHGGFSGWTHFSVVRNGTSVTFYKNGTSLGYITLSVNTAAAFRYLGREGSGFYYAGLIDDILIYQTNLSDSDIGYLASQRGAIYATT